MSSVTRPKGPHPPRVYWRRRLLVLGLAVLVVFGASRLVGPELARERGAVASPAASQATPTGSPSAEQPGASASPTPAASERPRAKAKRRPKATRPEPSATPVGACAADDIQVTPAIDEAVAGTEVTITLFLTTKVAPACSWQVGPESMVLKLTSDDDRLWSTQDCPDAVPTQPVVVRHDALTMVEVVWSGQESDEECTAATPWVEPGYYHAVAAALGGEPVDTGFALKDPREQSSPSAAPIAGSAGPSQT
jgi:hypothetical protein